MTVQWLELGIAALALVKAGYEVGQGLGYW
jgi:hypothetical protein